MSPLGQDGARLGDKLGYTLRDDGEALEGFKQENDRVRSVSSEECSDSIEGVSGG